MYDLDIVFTFKQLNFKGITFKSQGYLLNLGQQFPNNVTISDSTFKNISHGSILVTSSNLQNNVLLTHVNFINITVDDIEEDSTSFIEVKEGGRVHISSSKFINMHCFQTGGVIFGGSKATITIIRNSVFKNNVAVSGAVFQIEQESIIKCYNCTITENFALTSGVANVFQNGKFEFYDSQIYSNYAHNNPVSQLLESALTSIIDHCQIYQNVNLDKAQLDIEFNGTCSKLCFLNTKFIQFFKFNFQAEITSKGVNSLFQLISTSLIIQNRSKIFQQDSIIEAFLSEVEITNSTISDINVTGVSIEILSSQLSLTNVEAFNILNQNQSNFILIFLESKLIMNNFTYSNSSSILFNSQKSSVEASFLLLNNITGATNLFTLSDNFNVTMNQVITTNVQVLNKELYRVSLSKNVSLIKFKSSGINKTIIDIRSSNVTEITNFELKNCTRGIKVLSSTINEIKNTILEDNGNSLLLNGGAINIQDSLVMIKNTTISRNKAKVGGGIYFGCISLSLCNLVISNTTFESNSAYEGGAIFYNYKRPVFKADIIFNSNSADYGPNIASYAVKITMADDLKMNLAIDKLGSGIKYEKQLGLVVRDYDDQRMVLNNKDQIILTSNDNTKAQVLGFNSAPLIKGEAKFDNFIVVAKPGAENIKVLASSNAINKNKISTIFGSAQSGNLININFRY